MTHFEYQFGAHEVLGGPVPVPDDLTGKDVRADPAARMAVLTAAKLVHSRSEADRSALNVIVLTRKGCASHIKKVVDNVSRRVPSQGYFARGGPQTLATYTALALGCHGCAFSFIGDMEILNDAVAMAFFMATTPDSSGTVLTAVSQQESDRFQGQSVLISIKNDGADSSDNRMEAENAVQGYLAILLDKES